MYEILEHAADLGFRVRAGSFPELLERAAEALVGIALEIEPIAERESYPIEAEGDSNESLLVNWLSEVLYYLDGKLLALRRFQVNSLSPERVAGVAFGEPRDPSRHPARLIVKGITYHQLKIEQNEHGWSCEVYVDV
ncbi:MAG TPA: archease [Bryobacteraceae bacterium]|jgi:SHS2 domain-containing protein|nr:archease [Bryobacteraceae bacterium]